VKHSLPVNETPGTPQLHLLVRTPRQLDAAVTLKPASITLDYLDLYGLRPSVERVKACGIHARVASPRVLKPGESKIVNFLLSLECDIVVRATGILQALRDRTHPPLIGDFSLNAANSLTTELLLEMGLHRITPTHDLNAAQVMELAQLAGPSRMEVVAYQHLPVFHTEHCVFCRFLSTGTSYLDCGRPCEKHEVSLRDHTGRRHPVIADVGCRNTVFGAEAQHGASHLDAWLRAGIRHYRLEFVHESGDQLRAIAEAWQSALQGQLNPVALQTQLRRASPEGITEGSLFIPLTSLLPTS
jgi:putative protease